MVVIIEWRISEVYRFVVFDVWNKNRYLVCRICKYFFVIRI